MARISNGSRLLELVLWCLAAISLLRPVCGYAKLSDETLQHLPKPGNAFDIHNGPLLAPILHPRVSGTPGSLAALEHFVKFFRESLPDWTLEFQNSTSKTPVHGNKDVPFINLIARRDPPWASHGDVSRLTLVAHYDSKYKPDGFIGATDSAAPCAIILHAIKSVDAALTKKWKEAEADPTHEMLLDEHKGVQVFLLDGEEAFLNWSDDDSLYGARSLAAEMDEAVYPAMSTFKTPLTAISLFVLLDLLGSASPNIPSYFRTTHWAYKHMAKLESRLRDLGELKSQPPKRPTEPGKETPWNKEGNTWFKESSKESSSFMNGGVQDDHIPFMARGVNVLHLIPTPFPAVWHTMNDDGEHLDINTVNDWGTVMTAFVAEWFELDGYFDTQKPASRDLGSEDARKTELN